MTIGEHTIERIRSFFNDLSIQLYDLICAECRAKSQMRKINGEPKSRQIIIDNTSSNGNNIDLESSSEKTNDEFSESNESETIQTKNVTRVG